MGDRIQRTTHALGAARRVAIALRASQLLAFGLVVSVGAILAATLTPNVGSLEPPPGNTFCDLTRMSLAPLEELLSLNDEPSLNVLLFLPLGLVMGLLPRSAGKVALLARRDRPTSRRRVPPGPADAAQPFVLQR